VKDNGAEIHNNLFLYNGWDSPARGSAYGLYIQNESETGVINVHDNIIFAGFSKGTHVYGESVSALKNVTFHNNVSFEAGLISKEALEFGGASESCIFVGGLAPLDGMT
jgi:hypothetical protein